MANLIYQNEGAVITWKDSTGDHDFTLQNLAAGAGRQGAIHDFGVGARSQQFEWRLALTAGFETQPVVSEFLGIYVKTGTGTSADNDDGTGDIAVSAEDKLKNLSRIGTLIVDEAIVDIPIAKSGFILLPSRFFMPLVWNFATDNLQDTANTTIFTLTPVPFEAQ